MGTAPKPAANRVVHSMSKVPAVGILFWVVKLVSTGMGEAWSDFLGEKAIWGFGIVAVALVASLVVQFRLDRYRPVAYWTVVSLVAVVGTIGSDGMHVILGFSRPVVAGFFCVVLAAVIGVWRYVEGTVSIHSITTRRREIFYWLTVATSFSLGTALGDLTAYYLGWGYIISIAVFAAGMLVAWGLYGSRLLGEVSTFWVAYALTRPVGASVADWLGKRDGLGFGDGPVAVTALVIVVALVAYLAVTHSDEDSPEVVAAAERVASEHELGALRLDRPLAED